MYQVIARKYRPQNFAELIGQEHVRTTLENAISQKRIAHGYILSGQRGPTYRLSSPRKSKSTAAPADELHRPAFTAEGGLHRCFEFHWEFF